MQETSVLESKWISIEINERYSGLTYYENIKKELQRVFLSDLEDVLFIGDYLGDNLFDNALDTYIFIKCRNIFEHRNELKKIKYVKNVLSSFTDIKFLSEQEIKDVKSSWSVKKDKESVDFFFGDIVKIKAGMYGNLIGIIYDKAKNGNFVIAFKFHSCIRYDKIKAENLEKEGNIFTFMRLPVK